MSTSMCSTASSRSLMDMIQPFGRTPRRHSKRLSKRFAMPQARQLIGSGQPVSTPPELRRADRGLAGLFVGCLRPRYRAAVWSGTSARGCFSPAPVHTEPVMYGSQRLPWPRAQLLNGAFTVQEVVSSGSLVRLRFAARLSFCEMSRLTRRVGRIVSAQEH